MAITLVIPEAAGNTYLVSDDDDISTPELIRRIAGTLGKHPRLFSMPPALLRMAGIATGKSSVIDRLLGSLTIYSSKIRHELGWTPSFTMEQGLRETVAWFRNSQRNADH